MFCKKCEKSCGMSIFFVSLPGRGMNMSARKVHSFRVYGIYWRFMSLIQFWNVIRVLSWIIGSSQWISEMIGRNIFGYFCDEFHVLNIFQVVGKFSLISFLFVHVRSFFCCNSNFQLFANFANFFLMVQGRYRSGILLCLRSSYEFVSSSDVIGYFRMNSDCHGIFNYSIVLHVYSFESLQSIKKLFGCFREHSGVLDEHRK